MSKELPSKRNSAHVKVIVKGYGTEKIAGVQKIKEGEEHLILVADKHNGPARYKFKQEDVIFYRSSFDKNLNVKKVTPE